MVTQNLRSGFSAHRQLVTTRILARAAFIAQFVPISRVIALDQVEVRSTMCSGLGDSVEDNLDFTEKLVVETGSHSMWSVSLTTSHGWHNATASIPFETH